MRYKSTSLVVTLKEAEGMKTIMPRVKPEWCVQVIIVDGNSAESRQNVAAVCSQTRDIRTNLPFGAPRDLVPEALELMRR